MVHQSLVFAIALLFSNVLQAQSIQVVGLFSGGAAVVLMDGKRFIVKKGQTSPSGIHLLKVTDDSAVLRVNNQINEYFLSRANSRGYVKKSSDIKDKAAENKKDYGDEIQIKKDDLGHFVTSIMINNKSVEAMIDTGATAIGINKKTASLLGLNYKMGEIVEVETAGGKVKAYSLILQSVALGNIKVQEVAAIVTEDKFPEIILLGMSFMKYTDMRYKNDILYIKGSTSHQK